MANGFTRAYQKRNIRFAARGRIYWDYSLFFNILKLHISILHAVNATQMILHLPIQFIEPIKPLKEAQKKPIACLQKWIRIDMIISDESENVIIELKRGSSRSHFESGVNQLMRYMEISSTKQAILFLYLGKETEYTLSDYGLTGPDKKLIVVEPANSTTKLT